MGDREIGDQIRRVLLLATGQQRPSASADQLELPLWDAEPESPGSPLLDELKSRAHAIVLEAIILIQMETAGLVATPLRTRRRRVGLGGDPPLRLLAEWEGSRPVDEGPWSVGSPAPGREQAFAAGLGRLRSLAEAADLSPARIREIVRRLYAVAARSTSEDDLPGLILAHLHRSRLQVGASGRVSYQTDRILGRGAGVVHTPPTLASELVEILIPPGSEETPDVLDPACGSGQFLLSAAKRIAAAGCAATEQPDTCAERLSRLRGLHGVDLDPAAARVAAWNLSFWAARQAREVLCGKSGAPVDPGAFLDGIFGRTFPYFLGPQIQVGNSLQVEPSSFSPGFHWPARYPAIFDRKRPGFDVVLGNPPWISFGLRERVAAPEEERLYYQRLYPAGTQYKLTLYPLFIELALRLCRAGGVHGFLVPDSLLSGHHFSRIRRLLLADSDLLELTLVESGIWPEVCSGHTVLYAVRRKGADGPAPVHVRNRFLRRARPRGRAPVMLPGQEEKPRLAEERRAGLEQTLIWVPAVQYTPAGSAPLRIFRNEEEMSFLSQVSSSPVRIRDVAWTYSGLIARYGQKSVQAASPCASFVLRDAAGRRVYADDGALDCWRPALFSGGEVVPFEVRWKGGQIYWPARERLARIYKSGFDETRYLKPKVFLRQTGDRLVAAVDRSGRFCFNNLHVMGSLERLEIPPLLLAGILMSRPLQRAYEISSLEAARPLAQVDLKTVEDLPYPVDPGGVPIGAGPAPLRTLPQARRILRGLDRSLAADGAEIVEIAAEAWRTAPDPFQEGTLKGRDVLTLLYLRLLEYKEEEVHARSLKNVPASKPGPVSGRRGSARESARSLVLDSVLDGIGAIVFRVSSHSGGS